MGYYQDPELHRQFLRQVQIDHGRDERIYLDDTELREEECEAEETG